MKITDFGFLDHAYEGITRGPSGGPTLGLVQPCTRMPARACGAYVKKLPEQASRTAPRSIPVGHTRGSSLDQGIYRDVPQ